MQKGVILIVLFGFMFLISSAFASAEDCVLNVSLFNQDPYPAIQGEYVKLVFSVNGLTNPACGKIYFGVEDKFPISFDSGSSKNVILNSGNYVSGYSNYALVPFKVKVDKDAINDEYEISVNYMPNYPTGVFLTKKFNLAVEDSNTVFEVSVKDYDYTKNLLILEIINVGNKDVEALTVDIKPQETFTPKKTTRNIIGGLDSNDDTTFTFEGLPKTGDIKMTISFNDEQNIRRTVEESAYFDESLFSDSLLELQKPNYTPYYLLGVVVLIILIWIRSYFKKKRKIEQMKARRV